VTGRDAWRERVHRRRNALTGEWVLVSPQRTKRPWQGETTAPTREASLAYDPACYLCPGNARAGGATNPAYAQTYAFDNDYPALVAGTSEGGVVDVDGLLVARAERGHCRVVCFTPRHDASFASLDAVAARAVVDTWAAESATLRAEPGIEAVTVFENRGAAMGASNPHPHAQIWATETIPNELARELAGARTYYAERDACVLCAYVLRELQLGERIVYRNDAAVVLVPFWAVWPFEALVVPRGHAGTLDALAPKERDALADAMGMLARAYDRVFDTPFPYSMGFHQQPGEAPTDPADSELHVHAHYFPPLLRSASIRKYMVGFELLGMPQRDVTPESAAMRLRDTMYR